MNQMFRFCCDCVMVTHIRKNGKCSICKGSFVLLSRKDCLEIKEYKNDKLPIMEYYDLEDKINSSL